MELSITNNQLRSMFKNKLPLSDIEKLETIIENKIIANLDPHLDFNSLILESFTLLNSAESRSNSLSRQKGLVKFFNEIRLKNPKTREYIMSDIINFQYVLMRLFLYFANANLLTENTISELNKKINDIDIEHRNELKDVYNKLNNITIKLVEHEQEIEELKGKTNFSKNTSEHVDAYNSETTNKIIIENDKLKPILKDNLTKAIYYNFVESDLIYLPILPFLNNYQELKANYQELIELIDPQEEICKDDITSIIFGILQIPADLHLPIKARCLNVSSEYINEINSFISKTVENYLPNSISIDLQSFWDHNSQINLNQEILLSIEPYIEDLKKLESSRKELLNNSHNFNYIFTSHSWDYPSWVCTSWVYSDIAKDLIVGLDIGRVLLTCWEWGFINKIEKEIVNNFLTNFDDYINSWKDLYNEFYDFYESFLRNKTLSFIKISVNNMDYLFDKFSNNGIKLELLNNEILNILSTQENNLRDIEE